MDNGHTAAAVHTVHHVLRVDCAVHNLIYVSPLQGSKLYSTLTQGCAGPGGPAQPWASMCRPLGFCRFAAVVDVMDWVDVVDGG